jgi:hypothetical protein
MCNPTHNRRNYTMEHAFNTNFAAQYDLNITVLLHNFKCHSDNLQKERTVTQWIEKTVNTLGLCFHYWSQTKIQVLVNKLIKLNLLQRKKGHLNLYALTPMAFSFYSTQGV